MIFPKLFFGTLLLRDKISSSEYSKLFPEFVSKKQYIYKHLIYKHNHKYIYIILVTWSPWEVLDGTCGTERRYGENDIISGMGGPAYQHRISNLTCSKYINKTIEELIFQRTIIFQFIFSLWF